MTDIKKKKQELCSKTEYGFEDLCTVMEVLRSEEGCPWDREQNHESIRDNFIEETYEVIEAIDTDDPVLLREELGDVMLQIVFHARMEEENGGFNVNDVCNDVCKKLIHRHPHVFGDVTVGSSREVLDVWNEIKNEEKQRNTMTAKLRAIPPMLPALMRAEKVGKKAKCFDFTDSESVRAKLDEELHEVDEIIRIAENNKSGKPVICNDFADSSNAGAAGDSVEVLERIIALESDITALIYMNDGPFADKCAELGVGKTIKAPLGAFKSKNLYTPIQVEAKIRAIFDGILTIDNGVQVNMGVSAVIQIRNTIVVVTHEHCMNGDPRLYRCFGYDVCNFDMVVVKACTSFRAFYGPLTDLIYPAATHGAASADLLGMNFTKLSRDFYPFSDNEFVPEIDARGFNSK